MLCNGRLNITLLINLVAMKCVYHPEAWSAQQVFPLSQLHLLGFKASIIARTILSACLPCVLIYQVMKPDEYCALRWK